MFTYTNFLLLHFSIGFGLWPTVNIESNICAQGSHGTDDAGDSSDFGLQGSKVPKSGKFSAQDADEASCKIWRR